MNVVRAILCGQFKCAQYIIGKDPPEDPHVFELAAARADIQTIVELYRSGCPYNSDMVIAAASSRSDALTPQIMDILFSLDILPSDSLAAGKIFNTSVYGMEYVIRAGYRFKFTPYALIALEITLPDTIDTRDLVYRCCAGGFAHCANYLIVSGYYLDAKSCTKIAIIRDHLSVIRMLVETCRVALSQEHVNMAISAGSIKCLGYMLDTMKNVK